MNELRALFFQVGSSFERQWTCRLRSGSGTVVSNHSFNNNSGGESLSFTSNRQWNECLSSLMMTSSLFLLFFRLVACPPYRIFQISLLVFGLA